MQFISIPVTAGFTSAAAITIASGQLKSLVGIKAGSSNEFIESWINFVEHIRDIQLWDSLLGCGTIILLLLLKVRSTLLLVKPTNNRSSIDNFAEN